MSWIYVLLIVEMFFLCLAWLTTDGDLTSVSVVVTMVSIVSTLFNIYAIDMWDNPTFYMETVVAVSLALLAVILADFISIYFIKRKNKVNLERYGLNEIVIPHGKVIIATLMCIILAVLYYINIRAIGIKIGLNVSTAITVIKGNYEDTSMRLNVFIRQGYKFIAAFAYIGLFIFINNVIASKHVRKNIVHLVPSGCFILVCILSGGRVDIIRLLSAAFIFYMILSRENGGWQAKVQKKTNWKIIKIAIPVFFVVAVVMTQLRTIVKGDITTNQITNIIDYIAYYIGGSLQVLNIKIHKGILKYRLGYFGGLTFRGFWNYISKFGFTQEYIPLNISTYEYLLTRMGIGGNASTFVGSSLFDFGYVGMFITIFCEYSVLSWFYYKRLFYKNSSYLRNKNLIIYGFCFFIVSMSYYDDGVYLILSQTGIITLVFLLAAYWFYFKVKFIIKR